MSLTIAATAQPSPKVKAKRTFSHKSESSQGKNNEVRCKLESFKTAKSPKPYKYYNSK